MVKSECGIVAGLIDCFPNRYEILPAAVLLRRLNSKPDSMGHLFLNAG
jgi:hypothetical protein